MKNRTPIHAIFAFCLYLCSAGFAQAENLSPATFYGTFQGSGYAENRDSVYFGTTVRDLDVVIAPSGSGFSVTWTTVIRSGGNPNDPNVKPSRFHQPAKQVFFAARHPATRFREIRISGRGSGSTP